MRKLFSAVIRGSKIFSLVILLLLGWLFWGIFKFIKGDNWAQKQKDKFAGVNPAQADVPQVGGGIWGGGSTPFLAVWNGEEYKIENDILFGKPRSYFADFWEGKREYESNRITPDLYKIQNKFKPKDGKLSFQIQEIEPEESFLNGIELLRVVHPKGSEIIVDSDYKKFYALDKNSAENNLVGPAAIINGDGRDVGVLIKEKNLWGEADSDEEIFFNKNDYIDLRFNNLEPASKLLLAIKSRYRVWVMGEDVSVWSRATFIANNLLASDNISEKVGVASAAMLGIWLWSLYSRAFFLPPLFMLDSGSDSGGGSGSGGRCLQIFSQSQRGNNYHYISTVEPRGWKSSLELVELPREAISGSGELSIRIFATERHYIGFAGLFKQSQEVPSRIESLQIKKAYHHRLRTDAAESLQYQLGNYIHTIPGDTVDIEFEEPKTKLRRGEVESYLIRAAGFYTCLSPESKKLAGNWEEKLTAEAKERLVMIRSESEDSSDI